MSFSSILSAILEECDAGIGAALMGYDGIPIEEVAAEASDDSPLLVDVSTAGVEFGRILEYTRKASDALGGGGMEESVVRLERFTLVFQSVDEENFLVLALRPDGNLGKARYLIRRHLHAIRSEF